MKIFEKTLFPHSSQLAGEDDLRSLIDRLEVGRTDVTPEVTESGILRKGAPLYRWGYTLNEQIFLSLPLFARRMLKENSGWNDWESLYSIIFMEPPDLALVMACSKSNKTEHLGVMGWMNITDLEMFFSLISGEAVLIKHHPSRFEARVLGISAVELRLI